MTNDHLKTHGEVDLGVRRCVEALIAEGVCRSAIYHQSTASTNSLALSDCSSADDDSLPRLYLADRQLTGRGRHGRSWHSGEGSLTFSLLASQQPTTSPVAGLLSIAVGVALARAIEFCCAPLQTRLKWPNDVYIDQGKVAGILIETNQAAAARVVIGVGINVNEAPPWSDLLEGEQPTVVQPKSLAGAIGRSVARHEILTAVLTQIITTLEELRADSTAILDDFRSRCLLTAQMIRYQDAGSERTGECLGINEAGELRVKTGDQIQHCRSGEAHRLRVDGWSTSTPH